MKPIHVILSDDCPPDAAYVVDPGAVGTLTQRPELAQALAEGKRCVVAPNRHVRQGVEEALGRVGRITGL